MEIKPSIAIKVGLLISIGIFLSVILLFGIQNWRFLQAGYEIDVLFDSASGAMVVHAADLDGDGQQEKGFAAGV